jgi:hypothetical protein
VLTHPRVLLCSAVAECLFYLMLSPSATVASAMQEEEEKERRRYRLQCGTEHPRRERERESTESHRSILGTTTENSAPPFSFFKRAKKKRRGECVCRTTTSSPSLYLASAISTFKRHKFSAQWDSPSPAFNDHRRSRP